MKLKNVKVGQRVQVKYTSLYPTGCSLRSVAAYGVHDTYVGVIVETVDSDGDVLVCFASEGYENTFNDGTSKLYIHHSNLRKVK